MKKLLLGMFLIGSLAFGKFEQQLGIKELPTNNPEYVKLYQVDNNDSSILKIIKFNEQLNRSKMMDILNEKFKDLNLKYDTIYSTGVTFYNDETQDKFFMCLVNEVDNSIIIIYADDYKSVDKFSDYLTLNGLITAENSIDLAIALIKL